MRSAAASVAAAFQFLTLSPPLVKRAFTSEELGGAVGFFPLVGLFLGLVLALLALVLSYLFPVLVVAALVLASWILLTGALHFDGLLDTCDGLFGGNSPESRLEIMRDERVGAFATAGGILVMGVAFAAIVSLEGSLQPLIVAPVAGRWAMALAVVAFPYARKEGLGSWMKEHAGRGQAVLATIIATVTCALVAGWMGIAALALAAAVMWLVGRFTMSRIPGLTGDIYGTICVLVEIAILLLFVAQLTSFQ